jgi:hypothetical protein
MSFLTLLYDQTIKTDFKCIKARVTRTSTVKLPEDESIKKCEVKYNSTGLQGFTIYTQKNKYNIGESSCNDKVAMIDMLNSSWSIIGFTGKLTDFKVVELSGYLAPQMPVSGLQTDRLKSRYNKPVYLRDTDPKVIEDWIAIQDMFDAYKGSLKSLSR